MAKWTGDLSKYSKTQTNKVKEIKNKFVFSLYSSITQKTPVDTGRARGNWTVSPENPDLSVDENATKVKYRNYADMPKSKGDESMFISNALPYIVTLEYGGYPDPVKKGSLDKKTGRYVIKSANGYSKQAPNGMVGVTIADAKNILDKVIRETK